MHDRDLIHEDSIAAINQQGCCLGKYRIEVEGKYYCYLEHLFDCKHQDKRYVKSFKSVMFTCKTNNQLPCQLCENYTKSLPVGQAQSV